MSSKEHKGPSIRITVVERPEEKRIELTVEGPEERPTIGGTKFCEIEDPDTLLANSIVTTIDLFTAKMNYYRQMVEITGGDEKRKYIQLRRKANQQLIELTEKYPKVRVSPKYSVSELKDAVKGKTAEEWRKLHPGME